MAVCLDVQHDGEVKADMQSALKVTLNDYRWLTCAEQHSKAEWESPGLSGCNAAWGSLGECHVNQNYTSACHLDWREELCVRSAAFANVPVARGPLPVPMAPKRSTHARTHTRTAHASTPTRAHHADARRDMCGCRRLRWCPLRQQQHKD